MMTLEMPWVNTPKRDEALVALDQGFMAVERSRLVQIDHYPVIAFASTAA